MIIISADYCYNQDYLCKTDNSRINNYQIPLRHIRDLI